MLNSNFHPLPSSDARVGHSVLQRGVTFLRHFRLTVDILWQRIPADSSIRPCESSILLLRMPDQVHDSHRFVDPQKKIQFEYSVVSQLRLRSHTSTWKGHWVGLRLSRYSEICGLEVRTLSLSGAYYSIFCALGRSISAVLYSLSIHPR